MLPSVKKSYQTTIAIGLIIFLVIGGTGVVYYRFIKQPATKKKEFVISEKTKPSNSANFKTLAEDRIKQLTNGISLKEIEDTKPGSSFPLNKNQSASSTISNVQQLAIKPDTKKAEDLQKNYLDTDEVVFYSEIENKIYIDPIYISNEGSIVHSSSDIGRVTTNKSWTSTNFSKFVSLQNGVVQNLSLYTPEYSINYLGGSYAIKENFPTKKYFTSIANPDSTHNTEMVFLKSLINDTTVQNLGKITRDGKNLQLFESKPTLYSSNPNAITLPDGTQKIAKPELQTLQFTMRYYVDIENFSLYLSEVYQNGQLQSSSKTINSKEYRQPALDNYFHAEEIKNKTLKIVTTPDPNNDDTTLANFNSKFPIYYPEELYKPEKNLSIYIDFISQTEAYKLYNSNDYNPAIDSSLESKDDNPVLATYSAHISGKNGIYSFSVNIFKKQPSIGNGKQHSDIYSVFSQQYGDYFYQFNQLTEGDNLSPNLTYFKLSDEKAIQITNAIKQRNDSYPQYESIKLSDISDTFRYLPGDLSKEFNNLELGNISHSPKQTNTDACNDQLDSVYLIIPCLVEKYHGYTLYFRRISLISPTPLPGSTTTEQLNYVDISVLDTPLKNINIEELKTKVKETPDFIEELNLPNFYEVNGKTVVTSNQTSNNKKSVEKIVNKLEIDKDKEILEAQLEKNMDNRVYDSATSMETSK